MLYIPKINDYLEIMTDQKETFSTISFSEYFKSIREKENVREVA